MNVGILIRYEGPEPGIPRRQFNPILRESFGTIARHWHRHMRPKHFTKAGAREYGYTLRQGEVAPRDSKEFKRSYYAKKLRLMGHDLPLVYTGKSREATKMATITQTSKGARISMPSGNLHYRSRKQRIDMMDEMRRISLREQTELAKVFDAEVQRRLQEVKDVRTVKAA